MSSVILQLLINALPASALSVLVMLALLWFSRQWVIAKLTSSTRHQYDVQIESLKSQLKTDGDQKLLEVKSQIDRQSSQLSSALALFSNTQSAVAERRVKAIDDLWSEVVTIRNCSAMAMRMADCLDSAELRKAVNDNPEAFNDLTPDAISKALQRNERLEESYRPYVEHYLWSLCWSYKAVHLRARLLLSKTIAGLGSKHWHEDFATVSLVKAMLTNDEFEQFSKSEFDKLKFLEHAVELKILRAMDRVLSGTKQSDDLLRQANTMDQKMAELRKQAEL